MKLLFISDIHGSLYYASKVIEVFNNEQCDLIISLGDLLYHGPRNPLPQEYNPKEVAGLFNQYKQYFIAVRGNCDSEVDQMLLEFPILADYSTLLVDGHRFFLTHGHHFHQDVLPPLQAGDILAYGHYHVPLATTKNDIYIINPSSTSLPKAGTNSYGIYEDHTFTIKDFEGKVIDSITFEKTQ